MVPLGSLFLFFFLPGPVFAEAPVLEIDTGGHKAKIKDIMFTADGRYLLSASNDKTVRVWDVATGETVRTIRGQSGEGHEGKIFAAALSPHDRLLAVGGYTKNDEIRLFNFQTGEVVRLLKGHGNVVLGLAFSPDGRRLISGSFDKTARIWDADSGQTLHVLKGHTDDIYAVAFSPDGARAVTGSDDHTLKLWDAASGSLIADLAGHTDKVKSAAFTPDGRYLLSGSHDKTVRLWDGKSGGFIKVLARQDSTVDSLSISPDGSRVLTGAGTGWGAGANTKSNNVFAIPSGERLASFSKHENIVLATAISPDGQTAATGGGNDEEIYLWDLDSGRELRKMVGKGQRVWSVGFAADGGAIAWGKTQRVKKVLFNHGPLEQSFRIRRENGGRKREDGKDETLRFAQGDKGQGSGDRGGRGIVAVPLDVETGSPPFQGGAGGGHQITPPHLPLEKGEELLVSHLPTMLALRLEKGEELLDGRDGRFELAMGEALAGDGGYVRAAESVGPWSVRTADGGIHPTLQILKNGGVIHEITRNITTGQDHRGLTLTPDGRIVISGGSNGFLTSYDTRTGRKLNDFVGHGGDVWAVAVSPDGRFLVSGSVDQTVRLWDVNTGKPLLTIFHGTDNQWVAWTPEGYYTSSLRGDRYIGWRVNRGEDKSALYFPGARFAKQFYSPEITAAYVETGGDLDTAIRLVNAQSPRRKPVQPKLVTEIQAMLPPAVFFQLPAERNVTVRQGSVRIKAAARSLNDEPITDIRLLLNGRPLGETRGIKAIAKSKKKIDGTRASIDMTIPLTQADNRISVIASNRFTQSEAETIHVTWDRSAGPKETPGSTHGVTGGGVDIYKPDLYLLSIGVSDYANGDYNLNYAHADAEAVARVFSGQAGKLYRQVKTRLLINEDANQDNVLDGLDWILQESTQKDVAVIFVAGHGMKDARGNYYFLPYDGDPDKLRRTAVKWFDFQDVLSSLPSKVVLLVDTCHSGSVTGKRRAVVDITDALRDLVTAESGVVVMAASTGRESSVERKEWGHGAFTKALLEGMEGKADYNKDGVIDIKEVDLYITHRVKELTNGAQHPTTEIPKTLPNFPLMVR